MKTVPLRVLILTGILMISWDVIPAQSFIKGVQLGMGVTKSNFSKDFIKLSDMNVSPVLSWQANVVLGFKQKHFGVSIEPGFIQKGVHTTLRGAVSGNTFKYHFIQAPVLAHFFFNEKTDLIVGPEIGYLVQSKQVNPSNVFERYEVSALVGVQQEIWSHCTIGIRYNYALTPLMRLQYTDDFGYDAGTLKERTQYLNLVVRYDL